MQNHQIDSHSSLKANKLILLFNAVLILLSCAQIVPLTGGDKDILPPKEVKSEPLNGSLFFDSKTIEIEFDEFIQLNNSASQLIVSPLMEPAPEVSVKGKKLVVKLLGNLKDSTTYSINFGNAITDITENNVFPNYKYVFSTGSYIDSLSYSGTVVDAFDVSKKDNIYVLLYDQLTDSVPLKELPRYVAITDKDGAFSISNIAHGNYKFFAINDINGNYLFDLPNEEIAFKDEIIMLDSSRSNNIVYLFEEENKLQFVVKSENKKRGKVEVILNLPTKNLTINPINKPINEAIENWSTIEKNKIGDSLTIWLAPPMLALENILLELKDGEEIIDTVDVTLLDKKKAKDSVITITTNISGSFDLNKDIVLSLNSPFVSYLGDSIQLYEDNVLITTSHFTATSLRKFELAYHFKENTNYQLFIPPATFTDIYGLQNDTLKVKFKTKKLADYGTILLKVTTNFTENYIVQLYKNKTLIKESTFKGASKIDYQYLLPGAYQLKLIIDNNEDTKWNTGNYLNHLQPEKVIFYEKDILIKANWDNDINWIIKE
ncbi:MAG: hypothetical protein COX70_09825 [Flavobacteriales bacterium CG_4_10_14_0_2_um_filter_32_8]|nr:MAG: hypothetical protein COX70_09825 [Flavobacteriales bacterium CG_4_10_14_0_2_um_filter_32_8]